MRGRLEIKRAHETERACVYQGSWGLAGRVPNSFLIRVYCLSDVVALDNLAAPVIPGEQVWVPFPKDC